MKESYLFDMTFNNVVFAGRNKAYGAYVLRQNYNRHILLAAILATVLFVTSLAMPLLNKTQDEVGSPTIPQKDKAGTTITIYDLPLPPATAPPVEQPQVTEAPKVRTIAYVVPKVVKDDSPDTGAETPNQQDLSNAIIGTTSQDGANASDLLPTVTPGEPGGTGAGEIGTDENAIHEFVADMPYFEGGEAGLLRYIGKKIRYPRQAVSEQIEGVVVVSFVVNRQGAITDATILKGLGYGTDEEALRVIRSMPNWTPGKQNGKPVSVRYTLPIRFSMKR